MAEIVTTTSAEHMTPASRTNVIADPDFGTLVSERDSATTWSEDSYEFRLTPWCNDPVSDPITEAFYICEGASGHFWSQTVLPTRTRPATASAIVSSTHAQDGIDSKLRVFVTIDSPINFSVLRLRNRSDWSRRLAVIGYLEWLLGAQFAKTQMHGVRGRRSPAMPPTTIASATLTQSRLRGRKAFYPSSSALRLIYQLQDVHAAQALARVPLLRAAASHQPLQRTSSTTASKLSHWSMTVRSTQSLRTLPTVFEPHTMQRRKSCNWE